MKRKIASQCVGLCLIGMAVYLYAIDNTHMAGPVEMIQQALDEPGWKDTYEIHLHETAKPNEFVGTATSKDGKLSDNFNFTVKVNGQDVTLTGRTENGEAVSLHVSKGRKPFFDNHPRLMVFNYVIAICLGVYGIVDVLLGIVGLRKLGLRRMEVFLRFGAVMCCVLIPFWVYHLVVLLQHWPVS